MNIQKIEDAFTGVLMGDAGGAGLEMISKEIISSELHFRNFINLREKKYSTNYTPGNYTDDRADTKAVIKLLTSDNPFDSEHLLQYITDEIKLYMRPDGTIRQGYGSIKDMFEGEKRRTIYEIRQDQQSRIDTGNAPLMRCLPLAFIKDEIKRNAYSDVVADVTHPHPLARECTKLVVEAIRQIMILEITQKDLITTLLASYDGSLAQDLKEIDSLPHPYYLSDSDLPLIAGPQPNPYMTKKGRIVYGLNGTSSHTAKSVIYLLKHCKSPLQGYKKSLLMGGDVDSLAALVLGTLAGRYGLEYSPLPQYLWTAEGIEEIDDLAGNFKTALER